MAYMRMMIVMAIPVGCGHNYRRMVHVGDVVQVEQGGNRNRRGRRSADEVARVMMSDRRGCPSNGPAGLQRAT